MSEEKKRRRFVRRLNLSYLGEIGSVELYSRQSRMSRDAELAEHLSAFVTDESNHARKLASMIIESKGYPWELKGPTRALFSFMGLVTGWLGVRSTLTLNIMLEKSGIDLYRAASLALPAGEERSRYQQELSQIIADEQKHQTWFRHKSELVGKKTNLTVE